jgi:hypothetical protein
MAERKFKDGNIVRISPSVFEKYKGDNLISYIGTVIKYDEDIRCYLICDVVGFLNTWIPQPDKEELVTKIIPYRISTQGDIALGLRAQELSVDVDEETLNEYKSTNIDYLRGNYFAEGTFNGGDVRLFPINTVKLNNFRLGAYRESYYTINIGSRTVEDLIGCFIKQRIDSVAEIWHYNGNNYRSNITFNVPNNVIIRKDDMQFIFDWKNKHQDFLVQGEVL